MDHAERMRDYEEHHETREELLRSEAGPPHCNERDVECQYARYTKHNEEWGMDYELDCQHGDTCVLDEEE